MPLVDSTDAANIDGKVHNHRFPAANTALPFVNQHPEQLKAVTEFLQNEVVTLDLLRMVDRSQATALKSHVAKIRGLMSWYVHGVSGTVSPLAQLMLLTSGWR